MQDEVTEATLARKSTQKQEKDLSYWLALHRAPGIGPARFTILLNAFPNLADLFKSPYKAKQHIKLADCTLAYLQKPDWNAVERDLTWMAQSSQHHILTINDERYPSRLREISSAPPLLFVCGDPSILSLPQMAMVGSRNPTPLGLETAHQFAKHLASCGLTITSGLAIGIDGASHRGALAGKGLTVAVTGTGLNNIYPIRHKELALQISQSGALVTEFPPDTPVKAENFPRRNRIISGLSLGVLVVEAALRSGSLITTRYAIEQGREAFAIPGSIHNPLAKGCHQLIRQGAKLVESADDILEEIAPMIDFQQEIPHITQQSDNLNPNKDTKKLAQEQLKLIECVGFEPSPIDTIVERSGLSANVVSSLLLDLELQRVITSVPGGYIRCSSGHR